MGCEDICEEARALGSTGEGFYYDYLDADEKIYEYGELANDTSLSLEIRNAYRDLKDAQLVRLADIVAEAEELGPAIEAAIKGCKDCLGKHTNDSNDRTFDSADEGDMSDIDNP